MANGNNSSTNTGQQGASNTPNIEDSSDDMDYDDEEDWAMIEGEARKVTQATNLPDPSTVKLHKLTAILTNPEHFHNWYKAVERALLAQRLHRLIDRSIKRPRQNSAEAQNWMQLSIMVQCWMSASISDTLMQRIKSRGKRVLFADEFMIQAKKVIQGTGYGATNAVIRRVLNLKRSVFPTAIQFLQEFQQRYTDALGMGLNMHPRSLLSIIDQQLYDEIHAQIPLIFSDIQDQTANNLTNEQFFAYCAKIEDHLRQRDQGKQHPATPHFL